MIADEEAQEEVNMIQDVIQEVKQKAKDAAPKPSKASKTEPKAWPDAGTIDFSFLELLQPKGAKIWFDKKRKRFQVFYELSSCSRAVMLHGENGAAKQVTRWAWKNHSRMTGEECPVVGLL